MTTVLEEYEAIRKELRQEALIRTDYHHHHQKFYGIRK
jgi:hypothetical protein